MDINATRLREVTRNQSFRDHLAEKLAKVVPLMVRKIVERRRLHFKVLGCATPEIHNRVICKLEGLSKLKED